MLIEVLTRPEALRTLQREWNALLVDSAADSIFLTWEWVTAWLETVRPTAPLLVVVARDGDGQLAALAPFYVTRLRLVHTVGYRCLRVIGDRDSGAEYPDIIVRRGLEEQVLPAIAAALCAQRRAWDCLWLPQLSGWTGARERFAALQGSPVPCRMNARPVTFGTVALPADPETYLQSLSGNTRSNIRRSRKRLASAAENVTVVQVERGAQLPESLAALFDLHQRRWQADGLPGCFTPQTRMRLFYERFAPVALQKGWLRLFALQTGGVTRAVQYGYAYAGTFYQVQEGYDPQAPEGIGNVLREHVFRACIAEGLHEYDFLGEFSEHKRRWGAQLRSGYDLFVGRPSWKTRALFARPIWPTGRYLREVEPQRAAPTRALAGASPDHADGAVVTE